MTPPELEAAIYARQTAEMQMRRLRAQAAVLMVIASGAVGFISGRASGWLVPMQSTPAAIASQQTAAAGKSSKPPMPVIDPSAPDNKEAAKATPRPPQPQPPAAPAPVAATPAPVAAAPASPARPPDPAAAADPNPPGVTLINPGATDPGARGWTPERTVLERRPEADRDTAPTLVGNPPGLPAGLPPGLEECERRYSSFRRSDGTYQPFGGGPRQTCPHLR